MTRTTTENYIEKGELITEWQKWKESAERVEDRQPSERLGELLLSIATKLTTHKNFRGYRHDMKDDMIQEACVKCLKNLKNVDPSKGSVFSYFTHVCWSAFVTYLAKYYTGLNRRRELMLARIEELESNPNLPNNPKLRELYRELEEELGLRKSEEF